MHSDIDLSSLVFLPYTGNYTNTFDNKARIAIPLELRQVIKQRYEIAELESGFQRLYFRPVEHEIEVYDNLMLVYLHNKGQIDYEGFFPATLDSKNRINIGTKNAEEMSLLEKEAIILGKGNYFLIAK